MAYKVRKRWFRYTGTLPSAKTEPAMLFIPITYKAFVLNVCGFQLVQLKNALGYNCVKRPIMIDVDSSKVTAYQVYRGQELAGYALQHEGGISTFFCCVFGPKPAADIKKANATPFTFYDYGDERCVSIIGSYLTTTRAGLSVSGSTSTT